MWNRVTLVILANLPAISGDIAALRDSDKSNDVAAIKDLLIRAVSTAEGVSAKDLLNDAEVVKAFDAAVSAIVALNHVVERHAAA